MRLGGDTGAGDEDDLDGGASAGVQVQPLSAQGRDAGDGETDDDEIREALETETEGGDSGSSRHSQFVQIGTEKVHPTFLQTTPKKLLFV